MGYEWTFFRGLKSLIWFCTTCTFFLLFPNTSDAQTSKKQLFEPPSRQPWVQVNLRRYGASVNDTSWNDINEDPRQAGLKAANLTDELGRPTGDSLFVDTPSTQLQNSSVGYRHWPQGVGDRGWGRAGFNTFSFHLTGLEPLAPYFFQFHSSNVAVRTDQILFTINGITSVSTPVRDNTSHLHEVLAITDSSGKVFISFQALDSDSSGTGYSNISGLRYKKAMQGPYGIIGMASFGGRLFPVQNNWDLSSRAIFINFRRYGAQTPDSRFNNVDHTSDFSTAGTKVFSLNDTAGAKTGIGFHLLKPADEPFGQFAVNGPYAKFLDSLSVTRGIAADKNDTLSFYLSGLTIGDAFDLWLFSSVNKDVGYRSVFINDSAYVYDGLEGNSNSWFKANVFATDSGTINIALTNFDPGDNETNVIQALALFSGHSRWFNPKALSAYIPTNQTPTSKPPTGSYKGPYTSLDSLAGSKLAIDSLMVIDPNTTYPQKNDFSENGLMNLFRWDNDKVYDLKGGKNRTKPQDIEILFEPGVPVRITGIRMLGHFGGLDLAVLGSDDGIHFDSIGRIKSNYNEEVVYHLEDTCQVLKLSTVNNSWPDGLEIYGDPIHGDPSLKLPAYPAVTPDFPDAGRSIAANIFVDDVKLSLSAFADGAMHREYVNHAWLMSATDSLYPKDKYMYAPMQFVGNLKEHWAVLDDLGQTSYLSLKAIPALYGRSAIKTKNDGVMAEIKLNLNDGSTVILEQETQKLRKNNSQVYLNDGLYRLNSKVLFLTNTGGTWTGLRADTIRVVGGKCKPALYKREEENKPVDNYYAPHTDPSNWLTYGRTLSTMTRIGGRNSNSSRQLMSKLLAPGQPKSTGLNTLKGVQAGNEDNKGWKTRMAYTTPEEMYAKMKLTYDSVKAVDSSMLVILSGLVGVEVNMHYYRKLMYLEELHQTQVFDIGAGHAYWSSAGNSSDHHTVKGRVGQTPEEYGAEDNLAKFQDEWYRWSGGRAFYLDEYGYDSDSRSDQALPPNGSIDEEGRQAEGLRRVFKVLSRYSVFQNKPMFMLRNPGNGGYRFATSGLTSTKANHILKDSWFMTHDYTHRLKDYQYAGDVNYGDRSKLGWATVYESMSDRQDKCFDLNAWTWNDSTGVIKLYVPQATSAFTTQHKKSHPWGISRELTPVNDTIQIQFSEASQLIFTYDDSVSIPKTPHSFFYTNATSGSASLKWENHSDFLQSQELQFTDDLIGQHTSWNSVNISYKARDTSIYNLQPNTTYYVRLRSQNSAGYSSFSDTIVVKTRMNQLVPDTLYRIDFNGGPYTTTESGWTGFEFPAGGRPREVEQLTLDSVSLTVKNIATAGTRTFYGMNKDTLSEEVYKDNWFTTDTMFFYLEGLDDSKYYSFKFFLATQFSDKQDTAFVGFNGMEAMQLAKANRDTWTVFHTIKPVNGRITGYIRAGKGERPAVNALKIHSYILDPLAFP